MNKSGTKGYFEIDNMMFLMDSNNTIIELIIYFLRLYPLDMLLYIVLI